MGMKEFGNEVKVSVHTNYLDFMKAVASGSGFNSIDEWIDHETLVEKESIYDLLDANLRDWGWDQYGQHIEQNEYDEDVDSEGVPVPDKIEAALR